MPSVIMNKTVNKAFIRGILRKGSKKKIMFVAIEISYRKQTNKTHQAVSFIQDFFFIDVFFLSYQAMCKDCDAD